MDGNRHFIFCSGTLENDWNGIILGSNFFCLFPFLHFARNISNGFTSMNENEVVIGYDKFGLWQLRM